MTYADSVERAALIGGLRGLADYLESNPEVPAPVYSTVYAFPLDSQWAGMRTEIDTIAVRLGVTARKTSAGHYVATRCFGSVEYHAVAIPPGNDSDSEQGE
jgi:hypothetical protein